METKKLSFYEKVNELQFSAVEIQKSGVNSQYGRNGSYKTFTDIKKAIFEKMRELKLVLLPGATNPSDMNLVYDKTSICYIQQWELIDAESKDRQIFNVPMVAINPSGTDKAHGASITYALKYIFNMLALLPDESLDPDLEKNTIERQNANFEEKSKKEVKEVVPQKSQPKIVIENVMNRLKQINCNLKQVDVEKLSKDEIVKEINAHIHGGNPICELVFEEDFK